MNTLNDNDLLFDNVSGSVIVSDFKRLFESKWSNEIVINEFASLDFDGFIAVRAEGGSTSMVMGSEGIIKQMSEGKLEVDINMPEISGLSLAKIIKNNSKISN